MPSIPPVPILMYHKIGAPVATKADTFLNVSATDFARQMRLLQRLGYQGINFEQTVQGIRGKAPLPPKPICVTFDDGYEGVFDHASPLLTDLGWPATVFIPTMYVGSGNTWDESAGYPIVPIMG